MNACASCRWIGSTDPGGYSTVIITASLPGRSGRALVISGATTACGAFAANAASEPQPINTAGTRLLSRDIASSLSAVTSRSDCSLKLDALLDRSAHQLNGSDAAFRQAIELEVGEDRAARFKGALQ